MSDPKIAKGSLPVGTIIFSGKDRYLIEEVLGAGGFGITYKVVRLSDRSLQAMKEFFPDKMCERGENHQMTYLKTNSQDIEVGIDNFLTEAERLNRHKISHPNIVAIDEVFKANNTAYYTMEFIDGQTLRQYIKKNGGKPLTVEQMLSVMRPVLQAVDELHKNKLTHLDIKHDNILLTFEDDDSLRPVLIDFGQSKHYDKKGKATSQLTNAGCSEGFAPQEQYLGLTTFTPQADIYALCATMLYLLTARQPAKSSEMSASKIASMLGDSIPAKIQDAIIAGMRANKEERTQTVQELASQLGLDIRDHDDHEGNVTRLLNINKPKKVKRERKPIDWQKWLKPALGAVAALAVLAVIVLSILWVVRNGGSGEDTDQPEVTAAVLPEEPTPQDSLIAENPAPPVEVEEVAKPQEQPTADEQAPAKPEEPKEPTDDELFARAKTIQDYQALANRGYGKAYAPLAEMYMKNGDYSSAARYAKQALNVSSTKGKAWDIIEQLDVYGTYDNGANGGKPAKP